MGVEDVTQVLVVGAGQMGAQIAMQAALHGVEVVLNDLSLALLEKAMQLNRSHLERRVAKGQLTTEEMEAAIARVRLEPDLDRAAAAADFVIEAIVERLKPKKACFVRLAAGGPGAGHPPLELRGFLVNRILRALAREAYFLLEEGVASFAGIDKAVELGLNHPMGPFRLADLSGLDIGYNARLETYEVTGDSKDRPPRALELRVKRGDLGRKTGRGFYDYTTNPPTPTPD